MNKKLMYLTIPNSCISNNDRRLFFYFSRTLYELCKKYDCKALIKPCVCNDDSAVAFVNPNLISGISFVYVNIKNLSLAKYNEAIHEFLHIYFKQKYDSHERELTVKTIANIILEEIIDNPIFELNIKNNFWYFHYNLVLYCNNKSRRSAEEVVCEPASAIPETNEKVFRHIINKDIGAKDFYDIAKLLYEKYK